MDIEKQQRENWIPWLIWILKVDNEDEHDDLDLLVHEFGYSYHYDSWFLACLRFFIFSLNLAIGVYAVFYGVLLLFVVGILLFELFFGDISKAVQALVE